MITSVFTCWLPRDKVGEDAEASCAHRTVQEVRRCLQELCKALTAQSRLEELANSSRSF